MVNDLGGSTDGTGKVSYCGYGRERDQSDGRRSRRELRFRREGEKLVKTAMDTWGRIDIIVNNAGILRDISFAKMKEKDWDFVNLVHLKGTYAVCKAAWPIMRQQSTDVS